MGDSNDRPLSGSRLFLRPAIAFLVIALAIYGLARWHPFSRSAGPVSTGQVKTGDPVAGKAVFAANCAACHGTDGGGGGVGPKLAGSSVTLAVAKQRIDLGKGVMPAGLVSGADEANVLGYLATILKGSGPGTDELTGDVYRGGIAFTQSCSGCHGTLGAGGSAPRLAGQSIPPAAVRQIVTEGRGAMPAGLVSGAQMENIVAYLAANVFAERP